MRTKSNAGTDAPPLIQRYIINRTCCVASFVFSSVTAVSLVIWVVIFSLKSLYLQLLYCLWVLLSLIPYYLAFLCGLPRWKSLLPTNRFIFGITSIVTSITLFCLLVAYLAISKNYYNPATHPTAKARANQLSSIAETAGELGFMYGLLLGTYVPFFCLFREAREDEDVSQETRIDAGDPAADYTHIVFTGKSVS